MTAGSIGQGPVAIGDVIVGKYRVERVLGSGGSGLVVLATHLQLDERVALKFLLGDDAASVAERTRATVKLRSDHVARVKDIDRHNSIPFIVMEYLEGQDLETLIRESGRLDDIGEAVELVLQACEGLAEAHRAGILHRDIKLANIFLVATRTGLPSVKLLDFGIARKETAFGSDVAVGTPRYMAPERLLGIDDDPRSDIWSLGIVLYELLAKSMPFRVEQTVALIAEILERDHASITTVRDDIPPKLVEVIDRALSKDPELRFQSAGELAGALAPFAPLRAQVHVERALEYGRPPKAPSSTPSIESARKTLAESSRALRASRNRASTTSGASSSRSLGLSSAGGSAIAKARRRGRWKAPVLWGIAGLLVVGGVIVVVQRTALTGGGATTATRRPATSLVPSAEASAGDPTGANPGWTSVAPDNPPSIATPTTSNSAAGGPHRHPGGPGPGPGLPPRHQGAQPGTTGAPPPTATASSGKPASTLDLPATSMAPPPPPTAKPTLEADPWKGSGGAAPPKPKMEDPFK